MAIGWMDTLKQNQQNRQNARRNIYAPPSGSEQDTPPEDTTRTPSDWWKNKPTPVKDFLQTGKPQGYWKTGKTPWKDWFNQRPTGMGGAGETKPPPPPPAITPENQPIFPTEDQGGGYNEVINNIPQPNIPAPVPTPDIPPAPQANMQGRYDEIPQEVKGTDPAITDFLGGVMNQDFLGPEAEQAYGDTLQAQIQEGYSRQRDELMKQVSDFGTSRGAFHSGKIREIASKQLRDLGESEQRDIGEMREKLAYTGLQRELQRQQQGINAAQTWSGYDTATKGQAMDFMTRGFENDIDAWFKSGSIDMDKFKTMISQNLGISELELSNTGQQYTLLATLMDYKLQNAKTELEKDYIQAQIEQIGSNMANATDQASTARAWMNLIGDIASAF